MSTESTAIGSCACGLVKFVVTLPAKWCSHCHCRACRQQHGAAFVTWLGVSWENFRLAGREHLKWYICSEDAKRGFCTSCGTPLLFMSLRWPDEVHLTRASLQGAVDVAPAFHIFFDQHVDWFPFEDSLPRRGGKGGIAPLDEPAPPHAGRRPRP